MMIAVRERAMWKPKGIYYDCQQNYTHLYLVTRGHNGATTYEDPEALDAIVIGDALERTYLAVHLGDLQAALRKVGYLLVRLEEPKR